MKCPISRFAMIGYNESLREKLLCTGIYPLSIIIIIIIIIIIK